MAKTKKKIVITGLGIISPAGLNLDDFWSSLCEGRSPVGTIQRFPIEKFPVRIAAEVKDFNARAYVSASQRKGLKVMARDIKFSVAAAKCAIDDSGLDLSQIDRARMGVTVGAALINSELGELAVCVRHSIDEAGKFSMKKFGTDGMAALFPLWLLKYLPNMPACHISIQHDLQGPNNSVTTACASGLEAIGEAARIIERNSADRMLAGGTDSKTNPIAMSRFCLMDLLSKRDVPPNEAYLPFDRRRDGFVAGEGAAMVILEGLGCARERGAHIYGEITGFGSSTGFDYDNKDRRDYEGMAFAMKRALDDAGCSTSDIDCIQANGHGTKTGDRLEAAAIRKVFGEHTENIPVTTFKPLTGYVGAASGAVGLVAACLSLKHGEVPPIPNIKEIDPECKLNLVCGTSKSASLCNIMINTFGLGGQNASMIVRRFDGELK